MLTLVLHLAQHISSTSDFSLLQALVQNLLLQSLLEDVMLNIFILKKENNF